MSIKRRCIIKVYIIAFYTAFTHTHKYIHNSAYCFVLFIFPFSVCLFWFLYFSALVFFLLLPFSRIVWFFLHKWSLRLKKREIEQQASTEWMNGRARDVIDIDDNIPFRANNDSTNSTTHVGTVTLNASSTTTTTATAADLNDGRFRFESTSLKTETIVLLFMFGICTIIYCSKYIIISTFKQQVVLCERETLNRCGWWKCHWNVKYNGASIYK